ncbi:unnamed protein product [Closterium sp. NIES-65]|nr:unnamed protein product [Closterium sp. NIES-65]
MHLAVVPTDVFNFDETALYISVLPRKTYGTARVAGRKIPKERLTVGFLINADGTHPFRPLVISKSKRLHDFRPEYDPEMLCCWRSNKKGWMTSKLFTAFTEHLNAAMYAEKQHIIILLDNASSHVLKTETATAEDLFSPKTIQRCWWRTGCLPAAWEMQLEHVGAAADVDEEAGDELEEELGDVRALIRHLNLGPSAMAAAEFVALDDMEPTCEEPGEDSLAVEPTTEATASSWDQPIPFAGVYDDTDPVTREARRNARSACEMLIGYSRAIGIEPRDISHLFDIRNPIIVERLERASPRLHLNEPAAAPTMEPARRGRVLPAWMTTPSRRQQLINGGITAAMGGYPESAEWFRI